MDGIKKTEETIKKWRKRKETNVRTGNRNLPVGFGDILGELFAE